MSVSTSYERFPVMGIKDSAKTFATRFKLDSHHAIERFGVFFGIIAVTGVLAFGASGVSAFSNNQATLSSTALYTPTFTTSRTDISGDVPGIFVNEDRTRAMVLMQFGDSSEVSANAEDYQGFLTGSTTSLNQQSLQTTVEGSVYMFGSTGYMGVMLDSDEPFTPQIMNLTMRANAELVYQESNGSTGAEESATTDGSFQEFDQWRVYFNPGGSEALVSEALDGDTIDVGAIYDEIVISTQETEIRNNLDSMLATMQTDLNRINDATAELERTSADGGTLSLETPEVPVQIAGDVVDGSRAVGEEPSTLDLKTDFVMPLGYDFDWRAGSIREGYLKDLVPEGSNYVSYLATRSDEEQDDFRINDMEWLLSDGTNLFEDYDSGNATVAPLFNIVNRLSQAYTDYYSNKEQYQVDLHNDLLDLEVSLRNVESNYTVHEGEEVVLSF